MSQPPIRQIVICGGGLAGQLCAAALLKNLPATVGITLIDMPGSDCRDAAYGTVTSPSIYDFLLRLGVSEPELLLQTHTSFSLGTRYADWGPLRRSWVQGFQQDLPVIDGVGFHHYVVRHGKTGATSPLAPYLMSEQAAKPGVFAHPPEDKHLPLSTLKYGYHFRPCDWTAFLAARLPKSRIKCLTGTIATANRLSDQITSLILDDGRVIEGDFFINATDNTFPDRKKRRSFTGRKLRLASRETSHDGPMATVRDLRATEYGWHAKTPLQGRAHTCVAYDPDLEELALSELGEPETRPIDMTLGYTTKAWVENCLSLGTVAACLEPFTCASFMMLQRDIERLVELIPVTFDMSVEAREYNRRFKADYSHADFFQRALIGQDSPVRSSYWQAATAEPISEGLALKLIQFDSRGTLVQYDLEPFEAQDWAILHFGSGRWPTRYDPLADRIPAARIKAVLDRMKIDKAAMAAKMPPHHIYMSGLLKYLKARHG